MSTIRNRQLADALDDAIGAVQAAIDVGDPYVHLGPVLRQLKTLRGKVGPLAPPSDTE